MTDRSIAGQTANPPKMERTITAPEGVILRVRLAAVSERFAALLLDLLIMAGIFAVVAIILLTMPGGMRGDGLVMAVLILLSFALRSFYFAWFELKWRGATPGKRAMHLRVIDRTGGPLRGDAVMARNLMREVELFLPLTLLLVLEFEAESRWVIVLTLVWTGVLALLPLFNRDRMRAGDMLAGTWVIVAPKHRLLPDVAAKVTAAAPSRDGRPAVAMPDYRFTEQQLAIYGTYELQVLEDVLRRRGPNARDVFGQVAERIRRKINWRPPDDTPFDPGRFLESFYRAQRSRLETDLAFGKRRANKRDR